MGRPARIALKPNLDAGDAPGTDLRDNCSKRSFDRFGVTDGVRLHTIDRRQPGAMRAAELVKELGPLVDRNLSDAQAVFPRGRCAGGALADLSL